MKNLKLKSSIYLLVIISAIIWVALAWYSNLNLSVAKDFFSLIPKVVTIDLLIITLFIKWGWRIKYFQSWLVPFPNLNGTWIGNINSDWINPETGEKVPPIPVMLTVKQSFLHISCLMHTGEMKSYSISEGFNVDREHQIKQLSYIYTSRPRINLNHRSNPHDGAIVFDIIEKPTKKLRGRYWTERKTKGEISFDFYSNDILEALPDDFEAHPLSEVKKEENV